MALGARISSFRIFIWAGLASLIVADISSALLIEPVAQDRSITATAYAADDYESFDDDDFSEATDFGLFDVGTSASAEVSGGIGSGGGSQTSQILPTMITANGGMFATGEVWEFNTFAGGFGRNRFDVTFDLTAQATYTMIGFTSGFDSGSTLVRLVGPGGIIHDITHDPNSERPFNRQGTLDPGQYQLIAQSQGSANGYDFYSDYASGEFDVIFSLDAVVSVSDAAVGPVAFAAYPNPFQVSTRIEVDGVSASDGVVVVDASGRRVRQLAVGRDEAVWDGRNDSGVSVPPGVYFVRAGRENVGKILRVR